MEISTILQVYLALPFLVLGCLIGLYRYVIRPKIFAGKTDAIVERYGRIHYNHAIVFIQYTVNNDQVEKKITCGTTFVRNPKKRINQINPLMKIGDTFPIRYKVNDPKKIYLVKQRLQFLPVLMYTSFGLSIFLFFIGQILPS
ncbi:hypothetical protein FLK61_41460 [Paenalkalicoccus suaedae]|uniref:DUF3592 domain-containing protein n=1 Tax=Paenalkalicoccus suaedae TaxID=2592382 RepID=A0A859FJR1_9BACI|nr:hypothetical protein [Paenalkalicoccus suaedae]QKS73060.1 hypothetical protein FLK61_41460 [Paenalkalicoccus suaedae]